MINKDTIIKVTNRNFGHAGYVVPDLGVNRQFAPGESKDITMDELRKLSYLPGGRRLIEDCLIIHDEDAVFELLSDVEPEYFYTKKEIEHLLLNGSLDQMLDCLDYAPNGCIELLKSMAVNLKINDISKRNAIKDKTGFDVSKAIEINEESEKIETENQTSVRRAAPIAVENKGEGAEGRRTAPPRYKVVVD